MEFISQTPGEAKFQCEPKNRSMAEKLDTLVILKITIGLVVNCPSPMTERLRALSFLVVTMDILRHHHCPKKI